MVRFFTNKIFKIFSLFFIPWIGLGAEVHLDKLIEYDQYASAKALQEADLSDLWNYFLYLAKGGTLGFGISCAISIV